MREAAARDRELRLKKQTTELETMFTWRGVPQIKN